MKIIHQQYFVIGLVELDAHALPRHHRRVVGDDRGEREPRLREGLFQTVANAAHPHVRLVRVELPMTLRVYVHGYDNARVRIAYPYESFAAPGVVASAPTQGHENAVRVPGR